MAGLLDYLYDPSTYSGNGGLLSRLAPSVASIPQSAGFPQSDQPAQAAPIQVGGYSMPRVGNADLYQPQQAMTPPNAMPTQGQLPAAMSQSAPTDQPGFMPFYQSMKHGGGLIGSILAGVTGRRTDPIGIQEQRANQTARYLTAKGFAPGLAQTIVSDPALLRAVLPQMLGFGGQTDDIKEFEYARKEDPTLTFQKFMQQKKAVSGEYSLTPQYGTDKDGNTVLLQTGKSGEAIQTKLPEGVKISSGIDKIDLGTQWGIIDKRNGNLVGTQPKDVAGKEAAEARGKAQGEAQAALPGALADAERTKASIDQLLKHEGLSSIVGPLDQYRPSWSLGEAGNDALARYKQLQGQAFLQAYNLLKGGGAITDIEGKKAEAAMARLDRAQSEETFKEALKDFRDAIESGVNKLKAKAGGTSAAPADSASANLKAKYGLD
jgi:hypothetical protein